MCVETVLEMCVCVETAPEMYVLKLTWNVCVETVLTNVTPLKIKINLKSNNRPTIMTTYQSPTQKPNIGFKNSQSKTNLTKTIFITNPHNTQIFSRIPGPNSVARLKGARLDTWGPPWAWVVII